MHDVKKSIRNSLRKAGRPLKNVIGSVQTMVHSSLGAGSQVETSVSLCTTVMNRLEHLQETYIRNIEDNQDYDHCEFILLNYSCPDENTQPWVEQYLAKYIESGVLKYFYYPDAKFYNMSHSRNMAFRLSSGDVICNIDADNFTGESFAKYVAMNLTNQNGFLQGPADGRGLGGRICVPRENFFATGGYDERFVGWGYEDTDFANRLQMSGLSRRTILQEKFLASIPHHRDIRVMQYPEDKKVPKESKLVNKALADENIAEQIINANKDKFGMGRVQDINGQWINLDEIR